MLGASMMNRPVRLILAALLTAAPCLADDEQGIRVVGPSVRAPKPPPPSQIARELVKLAQEAPTPAGKVVRWDRYAAAWLHAMPASAGDAARAREQAARLLGVNDPGRLAALSFAAVARTVGRGGWPSFAHDSALGRLIDSGAADVVLFTDLGAVARAVRTVTEKDRLAVDVRAADGLVRVSSGKLEHRLWLSDVPARMLWTGQPFLNAWVDSLAETRRALDEYAALHKLLDKVCESPVEVRGPEFAHPKLTPNGVWRYQEMRADGITTEARVRVLQIERSPLGGTLIQVPLPPGVQPGPLPILTRPASGYQVGYVNERGDGALWLTARMAQDRGWDLEAIDERVARDTATVPLRGVLIPVPGHEGQAIVVVGRYAAALALYPGALRRVADEPLKKPSRVRVLAASTNALVIALPSLPADALPKAREAARAAEPAVLNETSPPLALDAMMDLPAEPSGQVWFAPARK
jgi:hypothetical protein